MCSCADYTNIKVESKERVNDKDESYYLIFTDKGVYKNADNLMFFKFNSSDIYNDLRVGRCYSIKKRFWRFRVLSIYENIMSVKEVDCN